MRGWMVNCDETGGICGGLFGMYHTSTWPGGGERMKRRARGDQAEVIRKNSLSPELRHSSALGRGAYSFGLDCNNRSSVST